MGGVRIRLVLLTCGLIVGGRAGAAPEPKPSSREGLLAAEAKALLPLLRSAVKEDVRRQAWYVATRLLAADPKQAEAEAALRAYRGRELQEGRDPTKAWLAARDVVFRRIGDAYLQFARDVEASGVKATDSSPYVERAFAYGTVAADAVASMEGSGNTWRGTYGTVKKGLVESALGPLASSISFPAEHDDAVLRYRCLWPDARVVEFGATRLVSSLPPEDAWRTVSTLTAEEAFFVRTFGSKMKEPPKDEDAHTDLVVAPDATIYAALGDAFVRDDSRSDFDASSSWYMPWKRRLLTLAPVKDNAWTGRDAAISGQAVRPMIRRHLGSGTGAYLHGRGSWFLDGFVGLFEGFVAKGPGEGDVDPARSWRLAAMRELFDRASHVSWIELLSLDRKQADAFPVRDVEFVFAGEKRDGRKLSVPASQATALVAAIWQMDAGAGPRRLAGIVEELYKRNRLPDLDKALGLAPGKTIDLAERFLRIPAPK